MSRQVGCNEVKKVTYPLMICNWIFGMGIIEYPLGRPRRLFSFLYIAIILIIYCLLSIYSYPQILDFSRQIEANEGIANIFFASHIFFTISSILLGWRRSLRMHSVLGRGIIADECLRKIETNNNCRKFFKQQFGKQLMHFIMIFVAIAMINFSYMYKKVETKNLMSIVTFNYPLIGLAIVDATFLNLVQYSNLKFKRLNNLLKNTLTTSFDCPQHLNTLKHYENEIDPLNPSARRSIINDRVYFVCTARAHLNLTIFCEKINEVYAVHILISVLAAIFTLTMSFYYSYNVFTSETNVATSYQKVFPMMGILVVYNMIKIYQITKCCSDVIQEAVTTGDIIAEMYDETINEECKDEIRNFEIQLIQHPLKFHVCNLIELDNGLTRKVIETVTTYLVILTQCGKVTLRE